MSLQMGIVGLPNVGKSTLFQALTKKPVTIANYPFATIDPNVGIVSVPDERVLGLASLSQSAKIIPAAIEFVDIAGIVKGAAEGQGLGNAFLGHIREVDAILHVVRVFQNSEIIHVENSPDPLRDFKTLNLELILKDLDSTERAFDKAESDARSGDKKKIERRDIIAGIKTILESEHLLSRQNLDHGTQEVAHEIGLLTQKPMLVVFNISDKELVENWSPDPPLLETLGAIPYLSIPIGIEAEAVNMEDAEAAEFRTLAGIQETGLSRLIHKSYELLGLITFFTTGADETRAWTIPQGSTAPRAGRAIHSDFEQKFIRAEIIHCDELLKSGSIAKVRELGLLRIEGKEYVVQDGDVIEFRI